MKTAEDTHTHKPHTVDSKHTHTITYMFHDMSDVDKLALCVLARGAAHIAQHCDSYAHVYTAQE